MRTRAARTISTCSLKFDNVRVPAANLAGGEAGLGKGFGFAMKTLDKSRACVGALLAGHRSPRSGRGHCFCQGRESPSVLLVSKRQGIQWMIADMATKIEASRQLVSHANDLQSKGLPFSKEAAMAKMFATQSAMEVCTDAIQLMGGKGYMKEDCGEAVPRHQGLLHLRGHQPDPEDRYLWRCSVRQGPLIYLVFRAWRGKRV